MNLINVDSLLALVTLVTMTSSQKLYSLTADQNGFNVSVAGILVLYNLFNFVIQQIVLFQKLIHIRIVNYLLLSNIKSNCIQEIPQALYIPGRVAKSVAYLAADAYLSADPGPGIASSIPFRSHTFVETDHEIISGHSPPFI